MNAAMSACTGNCNQGRTCTCAPSQPTNHRIGLMARLHMRWLRYQAAAIRAEREQYEAAGAVGPIYLRNSLLAELNLRVRAHHLEAT